MSIPAFDTQKALKAFTEGGFNDKQAETLVTTANDVMIENLATRADYLSLRNYLDQKFGSLGKRIDGLELRIDGLEQRIDGLEQRIDKLEQRIDKLEQRIGSLEQRFNEKFEALHRHLWVMGTGIVLINVALVSLVIALFGFLW